MSSAWTAAILGVQAVRPWAYYQLRRPEAALAGGKKAEEPDCWKPIYFPAQLSPVAKLPACRFFGLITVADYNSTRAEELGPAWLESDTGRCIYGCGAGMWRSILAAAKVPKLACIFTPKAYKPSWKCFRDIRCPKAIMETKTAAGRSHREGHSIVQFLFL